MTPLNFEYFTTFINECPDCSIENHYYCISIMKDMFLEAKRTFKQQKKPLKCGLFLFVKVEGKESNVEPIKRKWKIRSLVC